MEFYVLLPEFLGICKDGNVFYKLSSFQPITVVFPKDLSKIPVRSSATCNLAVHVIDTWSIIGPRPVVVTFSLILFFM